MTTIPFVTSDWRRDTAQEPVLKLRNRFYESNPSNPTEGSSLILRPGFEKYVNLGSTTTKGLYFSEGLFENDVFVIGDNSLYRVDVFGNVASSGTASTNQVTHNNQGAFVAPIEAIPGYFFYLNNRAPRVVIDGFFFHNTLTFTGVPENNSIVQIGDVYYKFTSGSVDTGTPDGTSVNPWLVQLAGATTRQNLAYAVMGYSGGGFLPGTTYSSDLIKHPLVNVSSVTSTTIVFYANASITGTSIPTTVAATAVMSWQFISFSTNGSVSNMGMLLPPNLTGGFNSVESFASYIILISNSSTTDETLAKFYWIPPGETYIDQINFATAELKADSLVSARAIGDYLWLLGTESIEIWSTTGDQTTPFTRVRGSTFNNGVLPGTDQVINNQLCLVGDDYKVRVFSGTSESVISDNSIEDRIQTLLENPGHPIVNDVRSWSFTSMGHTYYVLSVKNSTTLLYDLTTGQWCQWDSHGENYVRPFSCVAPVNMSTFSLTGRSSPIVGDYASGWLFYINPSYQFDDSTVDDLKYLISTTATAGYPMRMRETVKCNELYLTGSLGMPPFNINYLTDGVGGPILTDDDGRQLIETQDGYLPAGVANPSAVWLEISDDNGKTWSTFQEITVDLADWNQEIVWRSLGLIKAPGRIFRINDYGAMIRLDGLDMR